MTTPWADWLDRQITLRGWRSADAARAFGVDEAVVSRWRSGKQGPRRSSFRKIAEGLEIPILEVLVAAGYLTAKEAGVRPTANATLDEATPAELMAALLKRVDSLERAVGTPSSGGRVEVGYLDELPTEVADQPDSEAVGERDQGGEGRSHRAIGGT